MIKINLASRKQAAGGVQVSEAKGSGFGGLKVPSGISRMALDSDQLRSLPLKKFLLPIAVGIAASFYLDSVKEEEIQKVNEVYAKLGAEKTQLIASAGKIKGYEEMKKAMDADEAMMRTKIDTIQKLISDRTNPPKLLRSLASSIPKDVWLAEFKATDQDVTFKGYSLDFNQITDFMKNLSESAYFADLNIRNTQQSKDDTGLDVASFELAARRR